MLEPLIFPNEDIDPPDDGAIGHDGAWLTGLMLGPTIIRPLRFVPAQEPERPQPKRASHLAWLWLGWLSMAVLIAITERLLSR